MLNSFIFGSSSAECIMFFVIQMLASSPVIFMELVMEKETGILAFSQRAGYNGIRCKCLIGAFLFQDTFGKGEVGFMGQKDLSLVRYFEDQGRYADLINGFVFQGKQVVSEDDVQDMDSRVTGVIDRLKKRFLVQKYRDGVKRIVLGMGVAVVGLENQDRIHYGMPVRIMMEDAADYDRQMRRIGRLHRRKRDLQGDEFLGGFAKQDRLHPVLTICIYYGKKPYDGARQLYELMEIKDLPENLRGMVNNYKIQVLEVRNFKEIDRFKTDLREVFGFIQRAGDADAERKFTFENEEKFKALDEEAFDVIVAVTGAEELESMRDTYREEGGKINMCEAIRGMIEQGREEGIREGIRDKAYKTANNMYCRGFTALETASLLEEELETVKSWYLEWDKN